MCVYLCIWVFVYLYDLFALEWLGHKSGWCAVAGGKSATNLTNIPLQWSLELYNFTFILHDDHKYSLAPEHGQAKLIFERNAKLGVGVRIMQAGAIYPKEKITHPKLIGSNWIGQIYHHQDNIKNILNDMSLMIMILMTMMMTKCNKIDRYPGVMFSIILVQLCTARLLFVHHTNAIKHAGFVSSILNVFV